jgi:hypothetical protein
VRVSPKNKRILFCDESILDSEDERVRTFPFTTGKPNFTEVQRCFDTLLQIKIVDTPKVEKVGQLQDSSLDSIDVSQIDLDSDSDVQVDNATNNSRNDGLDENTIKAIEFVKKGKLTTLSQHIQRFGIDINTTLPDPRGISFLHIAASRGHTELVQYLLDHGADPTKTGISRKTRAYELSDSKSTRDAFRKYMAKEPSKWDYSQSGIPSALTPEMEEKQLEKLREKKMKLRERQKAMKIKQKELEIQQKAEEEAEKADRKPTIGDIRKGKFVEIPKLTNTELMNIGISPEVRAQMDREKRYVFAAV